MADLTGHKVLAIVSNYGIEQDELKVPMQHLTDAGAQVDVAAVERDTIQSLVGDKDPGETFTPTTTLQDADPGTYDLLLIPGGTINADNLRQEQRAVEIARTFIEAGKPVAAICHGPWTLVETGALTGKHLTSYASLQTDVRNAGGEWSDESVVVDDEGWTLITSRNPKDLPDFTGAIDRVLSAVRA
ncbi:MAG: DJ-1/PfpI/YhbO family deglycase/protease [Amnibacterium sp.]